MGETAVVVAVVGSSHGSHFAFTPNRFFIIHSSQVSSVSYTCGECTVVLMLLPLVLE